jgi:hypothetical protein
MQGGPTSGFIFHQWLQDFPEFKYKVLTTWQFIFHEWYIKVKILMIDCFQDLVLNNSLLVFKIHDKTRVRIRLSFYGHEEIEVMAMPVFIGTGAEYCLVFFIIPGRIIQPVRRTKMNLFGDINHSHYIFVIIGANIRRITSTNISFFII